MPVRKRVTNNDPDALGRSLPEQYFSRTGAPGEGFQLLKASTSMFPLLKVLIARKDLSIQLPAGGARKDRHEPVGVLIGQRPEEHGMDDAEHRRVGANAQRQRERDN